MERIYSETFYKSNNPDYALEIWQRLYLLASPILEAYQGDLFHDANCLTEWFSREELEPSNPAIAFFYQVRSTGTTFAHVCNPYLNPKQSGLTLDYLIPNSAIEGRSLYYVSLSALGTEKMHLQIWNLNERNGNNEIES